MDEYESDIAFDVTVPVDIFSIKSDITKGPDKLKLPLNDVVPDEYVWFVVFVCNADILVVFVAIFVFTVEIALVLTVIWLCSLAISDSSVVIRATVTALSDE